MKLKRYWPLVLSSLVLAPPHASALVAIGNGNYFVGFTDLEHDAPLNTFQLKIERTYNSRSQFDGLFGYGWGSDYEAFLLPSADGSVVIQESGGGDKTRFSPKDFSKAALEAQVDRLLEAYGKKEKAPASRLKEMRGKLRDILRECPAWDGRAYGIDVTDTTPSTLQVRALVTAKDAGDVWTVRVTVRERMIRWLCEEHPYALPRVNTADAVPARGRQVVSPNGSPAGRLYKQSRAGSG